MIPVRVPSHDLLEVVQHEQHSRAVEGLLQGRKRRSRAGVGETERIGARGGSDATVPIDECLTRTAVDLAGRPYLVWDAPVALEVPASG